MERYFEINKNGNNISCKLYADSLSEVEKVVIFCHGFAGHKDNSTAEKFAEEVLSEYKGIAILIFNLPCHGDDVKEKLVLQDCSEYLDIVIDYAKNYFRTVEIYSYGTSFGGYLVLKYIYEYGNPFKKISLRCPAVNMSDVLTQSIMKTDEYEQIKKGKTIPVGFDRKTRIDTKFLNSLSEADIRKYNYTDFADDIMIIQGTEDEIVSFGVVKKFADDNMIKFIPVENADHRFTNPQKKEIATKGTIQFFGFVN